MKIIWNRVTAFSQIVAIVLFVGIFCLGFYLGEKYEASAGYASSAAAGK